VTAPLRVGVVGVGALGRHHVRHLATMHGVELVGVFDSDPARAAEAATTFGCAAFSTGDDLLGKVEAVTVAVPTRDRKSVV